MGYGEGIQKALKKSKAEISELKETKRLVKLGVQIDNLKKHPNYKQPIPEKGESLIAFTLRYAAHLVSPPQEDGESYDVECVVIKAGILSLEEEINKQWNLYNKEK